MTLLDGPVTIRPAFGRRWVPALLVGAVAGIAAVVPTGSADAAGVVGPSSASPQAVSVPFAGIELDVSAPDDGALDADPGAAPDDGAGDPDAGAGGVDDSGTDGGSDADGSVDDGSADDSADPEDDPEAVAIDAKRRATVRPKTFSAKRVKAAGLTWTSWGSPTATARGRVTVAKKGRHGKAVRAAGAVTLSSLARCADGTPVYRRAVVSVGGKKLAKVALPGCSALR